MKQIILFMLLAGSMLSLVSCEKKDPLIEEEEISEENEAVAVHKELPMYVRITHEGDPTHFKLSLGVEISGQEALTTPVLGLSWDSNIKNATGIMYRWDGPVTNTALTLRPSREVASLNVHTSYGLEQYTDRVMSVKLEFFVKDKLVKTERFSFEGYKGHTVTHAVYAEDYFE